MVINEEYCQNEFTRYLKLSYWLLFFPHNCSVITSISDYSYRHNVIYPELSELRRMQKECIQGLTTSLRSVYNGSATSIIINGILALDRLIERGESDTHYRPVMRLYTLLFPEENGEIYSILIQLIRAYYNGPETVPGCDVVIPESHRLDATFGVPICKVEESARENADEAPFWRWYNRCIKPFLNNVENPQQTLVLMADTFSFAYIPYDPLRDCMELPLFDYLRRLSLVGMVIPTEGSKPENAVTLYSAAQFASSGISDVTVISSASKRPEEYITSDICCTGILERIRKEAASVSRFNVEDLTKAQISGSVEDFKAAELDFIERSYIPEGDRDPTLEPGENDPDDNVDLNPYPDQLGGFGTSNVSNEAADPFASEGDGETGGDEGGGDDEGSGDSGGDDTDTSSTSDKDSDGNTDDSFGSDSTSTDPAASGSPLGQDGDNKDDDRDKVVSSKNKISTKAYRAMWGQNPFILANDSDPEGYFYRQNVDTLNGLLREDTGKAIPKAVKILLDEWCRKWMNCADVRYTVRLIKDLGLAKYLKA